MGNPIKKDLEREAGSVACNLLPAVAPQATQPWSLHHIRKRGMFQ